MLVFPTISFYALDYIFQHAIHAGTMAKVAALCTGSTPYKSTYTGIPRLDDELCGLVGFFTVMLNPHNLPFNVELLTGLAALAAVPYIEAARQGRNILLEFHWVIGIIYQKFTGGAILPVYWLLFVVTGAASLHHKPQVNGNGAIDQKRAESIVFSLIFTYIIPSAAMLMANNIYVTAFWQAFPMWMYGSQKLYLLVRPASRTSGASTISIIYAGLFLLSAIPHLLLLTPILTSNPQPLAALSSLFIPSFAPLDPRSTTIDQGVMDFIKWDEAMMLVGAFTATVWVLGTSVKGFVGLVAWWVVSLALCGPGATVAGIFWWRERLIQAQNVPKETARKRSE